MKLQIQLLALFVVLFLVQGFSQEEYYPGPWYDWEEKSAEELGMNQQYIDSAVIYAQSMESTAPKNLELNHYLGFGREPFGFGVGPFKERGVQTGIIIKDGYIIAKWGEPKRVDMTFSVTKSFLSSTVGVAYDQGLIKDVSDLVDPYMAPILAVTPSLGSNKANALGDAQLLEPFKGAHNSRITWNHLLRQTSDWEGSLWGKPDWADRPSGDRETWMTRDRHEPGTVYEYNDTRVNLLALAAMNVWREPLPEILNEYVMEPIGATQTWRWYGYENSWVVIDGEMMQAVSGGGHWGGGMFISAYDQARFGLLTLRRGKWEDQQILSDEWVSMALTPTEANKSYGFMNWFLNTDKERLPSAPVSSFFHLGAGTNMVYVDPEHDLVIVARWIQRDAMDGIVKRVLQAIE